jgi:uncharacterized lipoprotein
MMKKYISKLLAVLIVAGLFTACSSASTDTPPSATETAPSADTATELVAQTIPDGALVIQKQGNFAVGGTVVKSDGEFDPM